MSKQLERKCVWAFQEGNKQDAERLLPQIGQPADIRTTTSYLPGVRWYTGPLSLLHMAAHHGWVDIIIDLVRKYKCNTNCKDSDGHTPLHYAASKNHLEVVRYLIYEQHCDPMTKDDYGNTSLHYACNHSYTHIVQYLLSTGKVNPLTKNKNGKTPMFKVDSTNRLSMLHLAARHGWMNIVIELIIKYKCDTNCRDSHGHTPLHYACDHSHTHIVQYLLSTGKVDPRTTNKYGKTPMFKEDDINRLPLLHLAATHGWKDIVIDLIAKYRCNTNCKDSHGCTPLHYAARNNHLEVVRYLINEQH